MYFAKRFIEILINWFLTNSKQSIKWEILSKWSIFHLLKWKLYFKSGKFFNWALLVSWINCSMFISFFSSSSSSSSSYFFQTDVGILNWFDIKILFCVSLIILLSPKLQKLLHDTLCELNLSQYMENEVHESRGGSFFLLAY